MKYISLRFLVYQYRLWIFTMLQDHDTTTHNLFYIKESDSGKAYLFAMEEDEELENTFWLPKKSIDVLHKGGNDIWEVEIPNWLCEDKGIM